MTFRKAISALPIRRKHWENAMTLAPESEMSFLMSIYIIQSNNEVSGRTDILRAKAMLDTN